MNELKLHNTSHTRSNNIKGCHTYIPTCAHALRHTSYTINAMLKGLRNIRDAAQESVGRTWSRAEKGSLQFTFQSRCVVADADPSALPRVSAAAILRKLLTEMANYMSVPPSPNDQQDKLSSQP